MTTLELWLGPEPTVNRVGDQYRDQLECSGFAHRLEDLDRLASTGAKRVRFPLLWERLAPDEHGVIDWRWADERMARLRELKLDPIVGLVHHGSGPRYTSLLDPAFPSRLARFATAVAQRYPWVSAYTPVNEPLTTARFSALYGHWYPHHCDDRSFVRALLQQIHGTAEAMRAVRNINPQTQLIQTEDLGFTHSTPLLRYQAEFENERRWLSFDLLSGRVDQHHPIWHFLLANGATADELFQLRETPSRPDVIGINAYVTSERFLDHRLERYPQLAAGGNGRHRYVDIEAVRAPGAPFGGLAARLQEVHERYQQPIAITEVHLGCTREEQLRWVDRAWRAAQTVKQTGVDLRAVTLWAAFGSTDWNSLLTRADGHYEPGLWDIRAPTPRPTALFTLARELGRGTVPSHPLLASPGWWERRHDSRQEATQCAQPHKDARPLLITGARGTLGRAFARLCVVRGIPYRLLHRHELDIAEAHSIDAACERWHPWAIVNAAGYVRVDDAEHDPKHWRDNATGVATLAAACAERDLPLLTFSSDLVFDGHKGSAYVESDQPNPLSAYGRSKVASERAAGSLCARALVVRTAAFFGPWDHHNFAHACVETLKQGKKFYAAADQVITPTYVPHLVNCALDLLIDGECGLWHLTNGEALSWADFARRIAVAAELDPAGVEGLTSAALGQTAARPVAVPLVSERGWPMPTLSAAMAQWIQEREHQILSTHGDHGEQLNQSTASTAASSAFATA